MENTVERGQTFPVTEYTGGSFTLAVSYVGNTNYNGSVTVDIYSSALKTHSLFLGPELTRYRYVLSYFLVSCRDK